MKPLLNERYNSPEARAFRDLIADEDGYISYDAPHGIVSFHKDTVDCGWYDGEWFCYPSCGIPRLIIGSQEDGAYLCDRHINRAFDLGYNMSVFTTGQLTLRS